MLEGYLLGPILGSDQCTLIPSPHPDLDCSLAFLVAAMVFQKLTFFSGKTESEVYRLAGTAVSIIKESLQLLCRVLPSSMSPTKSPTPISSSAAVSGRWLTMGPV